MHKPLPNSIPNNLPEHAISQALAAFDIEFSPMATGDLVNDSRQIKAGDIFCAVIGSASDGRQFIEKAIAAGARLILAQCHHSQQHGNMIERSVEQADGTINTAKIIQFYNLATRLFDLAAIYYQNPQQQLTLIGVTGTNGKTSTSQMIASLLNTCQHKAAVIGTTGAGMIENLTPIANTTPGPTELNQLMASFVEQDISHVAMEVSSHALEQQRIQAGQFAVAVFTNLTREHLDYHQTMAAYAQAKFEIFSGQQSQVAVINADDDYGQVWLKQLEQPVIAYGRSEKIARYARFVQASDIELSAHGISFTINTEHESVKANSQLLGMFNVDNALAAVATLLALDIPLARIAQAISQLTPSAGRMETYFADNKPTAIVDYAHTPDALENALVACQQHCQGELWVVFGCGGDRDKGKRPQMGSIAERYAQHVIITNDNPRSEAPELIAHDILSGCTRTEKITVMLDRNQAVRSTLIHAKPNDVVLLAGKGHESNIDIAGKIIEYNERAVVSQFYQGGEQQ
ncbi:UDP-N-acetylmuramoyl-L-alanyl-D-glutamate--2,6-diaminopimelate ligase [Colwellia sp. MEBiC06753]